MKRIFHRRHDDLFIDYKALKEMLVDLGMAELIQNYHWNASDSGEYPVLIHIN
ncbi:MAG: hypothetical protein ACI9F2_001068 [Lysobacterales bacterium]|jgi:hypothetical protein